MLNSFVLYGRAIGARLYFAGLFFLQSFNKTIYKFEEVVYIQENQRGIPAMDRTSEERTQILPRKIRQTQPQHQDSREGTTIKRFPWSLVLQPLSLVHLSAEGV